MSDQPLKLQLENQKGEVPATADATAAQGSSPESNDASPVAPEARDKSTALASDQRQKDRENLNKETRKINLSWQRLLQLYALPLVIILVFAGIIFALIIPTIYGIFGDLEEMNDITTQVESLDVTISNYEALRSRQAQIEEELASIDAVIPEDISSVVDFSGRIRKIARQDYNLRVTQAENSEIILTSAVDEDEEGETSEALAIIELPASLSMVGPLDNIQEFISAIQQTNDFIIIGEMELIAVVDTSLQPISQLSDGDWRLDITLIKYLFPVPNAQNNLQEIYSQVPPTVIINQEVLDFIANKTN